MREAHACATERPGLRAAAQAIQEFSKVGKPIYITETGIADARDALRAEWAEAYFRAVRPVACGVASGYPRHRTRVKSAPPGPAWSPQSWLCMHAAPIPWMPPWQATGSEDRVQV